jgi:hypothetical protein
VRQVVKLVQDHGQVSFVRVYGATTARLKEFDALKNLDHVQMAEFLERINNQKDL